MDFLRKIARNQDIVKCIDNTFCIIVKNTDSAPFYRNCLTDAHEAMLGQISTNIRDRVRLVSL
jgi:hypothetical protein